MSKVINNRTFSERIPWYEAGYVGPVCKDRKIKDYLALSPQNIKAELEQYVSSQDEACRQVAIIMYQHLHGHRSVNLIAGPTGSGKTYIAETLQKIFPEIVYIRDISNVTCDGWKGGKKVSTLFHGVSVPASVNGQIYPFIILDECDKMFSPKESSGGELVNEAVQAEFLSAIHGGELEVDEGENKPRMIDTKRMSFLFAGAFDRKARSIAKKESGKAIGFGASFEKIQAYNRELTMEDIREAGCISELCGRIQRVINLNRLEEGHFRKMLEANNSGPLFDLENEFNIRICLSNAKKAELAHQSYASGLGVRGLKNQLRCYIDEAIWENCSARSIEIV